MPTITAATVFATPIVPTFVTATAPPASPVDGQQVIVAAPATGVFAGHVGETATYSAATSTWSFTSPALNDEKYINGVLHIWDGTQWLVSDPTKPELGKYTPAGSNAVGTTTLQGALRRFVTPSDYTAPADAVAAAWTARAIMRLPSGSSAKLLCNPTAGDDFQDMAYWVAARHLLSESSEISLQVTDGLHDVATFADITNGRRLLIEGTAPPTLLPITGATFTLVSGNLYTANVTLSTALPARVVPGFAVGGQNVQGDGGADALNIGMTVLTIAPDRLSFTAEIISQGVALTDFTTPLATVTLGVLPNRLAVPMCTLRLNPSAGWDGNGAPREGFLNALTGGAILTNNIGLSYNAGANSRDIFFARDPGSMVSLTSTIVSGAGEFLLRTAHSGRMITNRSFLGGGASTFNGVAGGSLSMTRTMMGGCTGDGIAASSDTEVVIGNCVITGTSNALRTTTPTSAITVTSSRISRSVLGATPTKGNISIDSASSISNSTTPYNVSSNNSGTVHGNPTLTGNTNAPVTANAIQASGGVWQPAAVAPFTANFQRMGRFSATLDFPSIAANGGTADLTIAAAGVIAGDHPLHLHRSSMPPSGISYQLFIVAADTITVRATNHTAAAIDPTAFTGSVLVVRGV